MPTHTLHTNFAIIEVKGDAAADLLAELHLNRTGVSGDSSV